MTQHYLHSVTKWLLLLLTILGGHLAVAQETNNIQWLTFEELYDSLQVKPKQVFVYFYAEWCTYCHKMDKVAFQDKQVVATLNTTYYAVKMNVESADTIVFGNRQYVNENIKKVKAVHQIPLLMASRKNKPFSLPAMVILNEDFEATARYFQYVNAEQLMAILTRETKEQTADQKKPVNQD